MTHDTLALAHNLSSNPGYGDGKAFHLIQSKLDHFVRRSFLAACFPVLDSTRPKQGFKLLGGWESNQVPTYLGQAFNLYSRLTFLILSTS